MYFFSKIFYFESIAPATQKIETNQKILKKDVSFFSPISKEERQ